MSRLSSVGFWLRVSLRGGRWGAGVVFVLLLGGVSAGHGQSEGESVPFCDEPARRSTTLDTRGLGAVYCTSNPVVTRPLGAAHASARPLFYGAVPLAGGLAVLLRDDRNYADVYRLGLTQGATYGLVFALKRIVGRPRPYVTRALSSRSRHYEDPEQADAYTSFPSGHASLSAAMVASWSLSHPEWYVIGPGAVWALGVSLSRLHLGVHYPSDVLAGIGIGVGVAVLVHELRGSLTPGIVRGEETGAPNLSPPVTVRVRF